MKRCHTPFAVARLDGTLFFQEIGAGFLKGGSASLPVVNFKVGAGRQLHPVWAMNDLAEEIFAYCQAASEARVSRTHLQVSLVGSWVSKEYFSIIVAEDVEWHIASSALRAQAEYMYSSFKCGKQSWPQNMLLPPFSPGDMSHFGLHG